MVVIMVALCVISLICARRSTILTHRGPIHRDHSHKIRINYMNLQCPLKVLYLHLYLMLHLYHMLLSDWVVFMSGHNFPLDLGEFMKTISKHIFGITYAYVGLIFLYSKQVHCTLHGSCNCLQSHSSLKSRPWLFMIVCG